MAMISSSDDACRWIRRFAHSPRSDRRLICFPHAGGSASYYFPLAQALRSRFEVLAVQYPGRQDRRAETCVDTISELAERIAGALEPLTDVPFAFFGHSMGAIVAFEVARRLRWTPTGPLRLFASGRRAPCRIRDERVHLRDDAGLAAQLRQAGGTDHRLLAEDEIMAAVLPATRADYKAIETYRYQPGPPLDCPITVLVGQSDPLATLDEVSAWASHTAAGFDLRVFPGGHFYLDAHRGAVTDIIDAALRGVCNESV
jgi:pyochelin biosynthesis protein PchC